LNKSTGWKTFECIRKLGCVHFVQLLFICLQKKPGLDDICICEGNAACEQCITESSKSNVEFCICDGSSGSDSLYLEFHYIGKNYEVLFAKFLKCIEQGDTSDVSIIVNR